MGGEGVGAGGQGRAPPRLIVPPPGSTQVFICTTPLMKYDPCVPEKVRLPQRSTGKLSFRSSDLLKETMGDIPGSSEVKTLCSQYKGIRGQSLVWQLRSHMLYGPAKKKNHTSRNTESLGGAGVEGCLSQAVDPPSHLLALSSGAYLALLTLCPPHSIAGWRSTWDPSLWSALF